MKEIMNNRRKVDVKKGISLLLLLSLVLFSTSSWADGRDPTIKELMAEIKALKTRVAELESKVSEEEKQIQSHETQLQKHDEHIYHREGVGELFAAGGFRIGAAGTFIAQGTPNANNAGNGEDSAFDGSYSLEIELEQAFGDYGLAYILMEPGQGNGLDQDLSLFSIVNFDAYDTNSNVFVSEVWYEQYLFDDQLTITGGKIYVPNYLDTNEYANNENIQFISRMFRIADTIDLPTGDWTLGARVNLSPKTLDFIELEGMWAEADGDWEHIANHPFIAAQLNFIPARAFNYDEEVWGGNYRVYFFYNGRDHTKITDAERTKERNYGLGLSCDQMLTDTFGWFGRFGWQDPKVSTLEYHWSTGFQMTGKYWNRAQDIIAVGIGQAIPGKEYGEVGNPHNNETHLETYYAFKMNDYLTFSPDFQFIWYPNGVGNANDGDDDTIFVYGVRGHVGF